MVADAVENFDAYMKLGPKRIIFHLGAQKNLEEFENFLEGLDMYVRDNVEIGLAFRPNDDLTVVSKLSGKVDFLQCMGSDRVGFQGETLSGKAVEDIKFLKKNLPGLIISVDIGVNLENAQTLLEAGADRLCVGSGLWKSPDPIGTLQTFQNLVQ
jgi:ribulose-phosphate 3-epimerase